MKATIEYKTGKTETLELTRFELFNDKSMLLTGENELVLNGDLIRRIDIKEDKEKIIQDYFNASFRFNS
jgi:hypothetical protein